MLFRRQKPTRVHPVDSVEYAVASTAHRTPKTLDEILAASTKSPVRGPRNDPKSSYSSTSSRSGSDLERNREPQSRKTGYATIQTDATDKHAAFESDAFAVHMPTTRIPVMESTARPARPSPAAQAEVYRTYMEKARQVRERNNSQGFRVPSQLVSYGYASPNATELKTLVKSVSQPTSPPSPAGSFPISPPLPQHGWSAPERQHRSPVQGPRVLNESNKPHTLCRSVESGNHAATPSPRHRYRADSVAGASCSTTSPTHHLTTIKAQLKPKFNVQDVDRVQTESRYSLYTRSSPSPTNTSRSSSPSKSMPNFTACDFLEGDSIFGYRVKDIAGTVAGVCSASSSDREKEKITRVETGKKVPPKRLAISRWAWLKSSAPRAIKLTTSTTAGNTGAYSDPFVTHTSPLPTPTFLRSPVASRPASPKKLTRPGPPNPTGKFDSGFAQIKGLMFLLFKIAFSLYVIVALWFVLDAIRQAFYTLGAPFRVLRFLGATAWIWGSWAFMMLVRMWEKWGFKVALKGGWMWKMKW